jgi:hypothetical protein
MNKVNVSEKFDLFSEEWTPKNYSRFKWTIS